MRAMLGVRPIPISLVRSDRDDGRQGDPGKGRRLWAGRMKSIKTATVVLLVA
jgi:hypothetical protein